jgi:hypothetical protein
MSDLSRIKCICNKVDNDTKRNVLYNLVFNRSNFDDLKENDETIYIGLIFHICAKDIDINTIDDNIIYSIDKLNQDCNKECNNLYSGNEVYPEGSRYKELYQHFITLSTSCNIKFYKAGISYNPVDIVNASISNDDVLDGLDKIVKGTSPAIQPEKYLNIWITDYVPEYNIGGYAQFPWDLEKRQSTDGILIVSPVLDKKYSNKNLTAILTHEVGHWLGLYHTFQETFNYEGGAIDYRKGNQYEELQEMSGDCIVDTPPQKYPTSGNPYENPGYWPSSQATGESQRHYHQFMNFMDYTESSIRCMFTRDQVKKVRIMLGLYRPLIILESREYVKKNKQENKQEENNENKQENKQEENNENKQENKQEENNENNKEIGEIKIEKEIIKRDPINIIYDFNTNSEIIKNWKLTGKESSIKKEKKENKLVLTKTGEAELNIDLTGLEKVTLEFNAKIVHRKMNIMIKPPGVNSWYVDIIKPKISYSNYTFELMGPFDTIINDDETRDLYKIKFGIHGKRMSIPTYITQVRINGE